ncbi:MAG: hypothetical protein AAF394_19125 [Planctomycetota bacterium]
MILFSQMLQRWQSGLVACFVILAATPSLAIEPAKVDLKYRSYRNWKIQLPNETWFPVKDGIRIGHAGGDSFAVRFEGNDLQFDTDGDGKLDRTVKPLFNPTTNVSTTRVIFTGRNAEGEDFKYAVRLRNDANGWEWAPGGAMAGTISTVAGPLPIRLIDQNGNGKFDDVGSDAMTIGNSDNAVLLSSTIFAGDDLAEIEYLNQGKAISLKTYEGETAEIDLTTQFESKAVLLSSIIVSEDGKHSFDVGAIQGSVTVPAGTYKLAAGQIGLGKQRVFIEAGQVAPIKLLAGASKELKWGGPIKSEFRFDRVGNQVQFSPDAIWYYGKAGERYVGWSPIGKSPEFKITDADTGAVLEVAILPGSC